MLDTLFEVLHVVDFWLTLIFAHKITSINATFLCAQALSFIIGWLLVLWFGLVYLTFIVWNISFQVRRLNLLIVIMWQKMVNGGRVNNWICVNFSRNVQDSVARGFCYELAQMCQISGMVFDLNISFGHLLPISFWTSILFISKHWILCFYTGLCSWAIAGSCQWSSWACRKGFEKSIPWSNEQAPAP